MHTQDLSPAAWGVVVAFANDVPLRDCIETFGRDAAAEVLAYLNGSMMQTNPVAQRFREAWEGLGTLPATAESPEISGVR